jgi:hypothetical protein
MANKITVNLPAQVPSSDLLNAGMYGTGALVRVQWAASKLGSFADISGTGSTPTVAIVTGTESYPAYDPTGVSGTWYRARIEDSGGTRLSDWSAPRLTTYH